MEKYEELKNYIDGNRDDIPEEILIRLIDRLERLKQELNIND